MKKILTLMLIITALSLMVSCTLIDNVKNTIDEKLGLSEEDKNEDQVQGDSNNSDSNVPSDSEDSKVPDGSEGGNGNTSDTPDDSNTPDTPDKPETKYTYNDFTPTEKKLFEEYIGEIIPFIPNNEYYIEGYYYEDDYEHGLCFYTFGNTESDFENYRKLYSAYTLTDTYTDDYGDTWYTYEKNDVVVDLAFYYSDGEACVDVYVYSSLSTDLEDDTTGGDSGDTTDPDIKYTYTDFTNSDKALFREYIGEIIPFIPNNEYYIEGYYYEDDYEHGLCFYTFGNTESDFENYRKLYSAYTLTDTYTDDYGDTWYTYEKNDVVVNLAFYYYDGEACVDVYVYSSLSTDLEDDTTGGGGSSDGGNSGESGSDSNTEIITNENKGLPSDSDGVFDVDFTKAEIVKDVTDQGYYIDGCPTKGSPAILVIPVEFKDVTASSKGYSTAKLEAAFKGGAGSTDYYSVLEYYRISSYGQLELDITVLDFWFRPQSNSSVYASAYEDGNFIGDQMILNEALAYLEPLMDLSKFDSDGNSIIDAVILVNTLDIGEEDFYWAYRYWNYYTDDEGYYYEYDGVSANDYIWASYQFLHDSGYDYNGDILVDEDAMNTYTFIHEFGHVLGADDYYDTSYVGNHPMNGHDIMDSMLGDHSAYTKFNLGWITTSRLVVADESITLELEAFTKGGDTIIIANNWDESLGAYQEYYIVVYYTDTGLNGDGFGYFDSEGIVVYHINSAIYKEVYEGETYYDVYNSNTDASDEYGTEDNLIEFVTTSDGDYVYGVSDMLPSVTDDFGNKLAYTFVVDSLTDDTATITFSKI